MTWKKIRKRNHHQSWCQEQKPCLSKLWKETFDFVRPEDVTVLFVCFITELLELPAALQLREACVPERDQVVVLSSHDCGAIDEALEIWKATIALVSLTQSIQSGPSVRGKSHWQSSRWFLPFFVFYRSIEVGCELSLHPKMRTYKDEECYKCAGTSTLAVAEMFLAHEQKASVVCPICWLQGPELLVHAHRPFCVLWTAPRFAS